MVIAESAGARAAFDEPSAVGIAYVAACKSLRRFIAKLGATGADIEDIAQEALVCALKAEADHAIENPKAYLFRVAHNLTIRHRVRRARSIIEEIDEIEMEAIASLRPSVEDQVISRERLSLFFDALATLPPVCRQVFMMRTVHGHSHKDIAARLCISTSTVEKHLAKGFERCTEFMRNRETFGAIPAPAARAYAAVTGEERGAVYAVFA